MLRDIILRKSDLKMDYGVAERGDSDRVRIIRREGRGSQGEAQLTLN